MLLRTLPFGTSPLRKQRPRLPASQRCGRSAERGFGLLDTCAGLALSAAAAAMLLSGLRPLACALRVEAARGIVVDALLEARREAYVGDTTAAVEARPEAAALLLLPEGSARPLGDGVRVVSAPGDGSVEFRAGGSADNATVTVACGNATASVVVNQRGVVR